MKVIKPELAHKKKKKLPDDRRRVILSTRVMPSTLEMLKSMNCDTPGRAIDMLVKAFQHGGIRDMVDNNPDIEIFRIA